MVFFLCQAVPLPFSHIFNHGFPTETVMEKHETKKSKEKDDKGS
jgi:hypothetical protein